MIPSDLATRLRVLIESTVQPLPGITPIADDLPPFDSGQRFSALIQNPLPDGTFRALVAGKSITLALPDSAKSGDVLELVVTGKEGNTVTARHADNTAPSGSEPTQSKPSLSQTGQLISQLLTGRFSGNEAVMLRRGEPLLPAPPEAGAQQIASQLKQAVRSSGLFFESHQAKWVSGNMPLAQLLAEPQAQLAKPFAPPAAVTPHSPQASAGEPRAVPGAPQGRADQAGQVAAVTPQRLEQQSAALAAAIEKTLPQNERGSLQIPDSIMPLVHQQLETLASHQIVWQGQIWPGQQMQWTVFDPESEGHQEGEQEQAQWTSNLKLTLPSLGGVSAQLVLSAGGLALRLEVEDEHSASRLQAARQTLADALAASGIPLTGMSVSSHG